MASPTSPSTLNFIISLTFFFSNSKMDDIQFDNLTWNLCHIAYQSLAFILIYVLYYHTQIININYLWIAIFLSYCDWLIWRRTYSAVFLFLVLTGIILVFYKLYLRHQQIQTTINAKWSNMLLAY